MNPELYTATQGLIARQLELDMTSHNLANVNTVGFRGSRPFFEVFNAALASGPQNPLNNAANNQPVMKGQTLSHQQGPLKQTGNPFDLALEGDGFFKLETPYGTRYTRNGSFRRDALGTLVHQSGYPVLDEGNQRITLREGPIHVDAQGGIYQDDQLVAQTARVALTDPENLVPEEDVLLASANPNNPEVPANSTVHQGFLEQSNVNVLDQMVRLIEIQRGHELNAKVVQVMDREVMQRLLQTYGQFRA